MEKKKNEKSEDDGRSAMPSMTSESSMSSSDDDDDDDKMNQNEQRIGFHRNSYTSSNLMTTSSVVLTPSFFDDTSTTANYPLPLPMGESIASRILDSTDPRCSAFLPWASTPILSWIALYAPFLCTIVSEELRPKESNIELKSTQWRRREVTTYPIYSSDTHPHLDDLHEQGKDHITHSKNKADTSKMIYIRNHLTYTPLELESEWRKALCLPLNLLKTKPLGQTSLSHSKIYSKFPSTIPPDKMKVKKHSRRVVSTHTKKGKRKSPKSGRSGLSLNSLLHASSCERTGVELAVGLDSIDVQFQRGPSQNYALKLQSTINEMSFWFAPIHLTGLRAPPTNPILWPWCRSRTDKSQPSSEGMPASHFHVLKHLGRVFGDSKFQIEIPMYRGTSHIPTPRPPQDDSIPSHKTLAQIRLQISLESIEIALTSTDYANLLNVLYHNIIDLPQRLSTLYGSEIQDIIVNLKAPSQATKKPKTGPTSLGSEINIELSSLELNLLHARGDPLVQCQAQGVHIENENVVDDFGNQILNVDLKHFRAWNPSSEAHVITPLFNNPIAVGSKEDLKRGGGSNMVHLRISQHSFPLPLDCLSDSMNDIQLVIKEIVRCKMEGSIETLPDMSSGLPMVSYFDRFELTLHPFIVNLPKTLVDDFRVFLSSCTQHQQKTSPYLSPVYGTAMTKKNQSANNSGHPGFSSVLENAGYFNSVNKSPIKESNQFTVSSNGLISGKEIPTLKNRFLEDGNGSMLSKNDSIEMTGRKNLKFDRSPMSMMADASKSKISKRRSLANLMMSFDRGDKIPRNVMETADPFIAMECGEGSLLSVANPTNYVFLNYFRVNPLRIVLTTDHTLNLTGVDLMVRGYTVQDKLVEQGRAALDLGSAYARNVLKQAGSRVLSAKLRLVKNKILPGGPSLEENKHWHLQKCQEISISKALSTSPAYESDPSSLYPLSSNFDSGTEIASVHQLTTNEDHVPTEANMAWASSFLITNRKDLKSIMRRSSAKGFLRRSSGDTRKNES